MFSNKCSIHVETCKRMLRLVVTVNFMWLFCASEPKAVSLARYITRPSCRVKPLKVDVELTASSLSHCTMMCKDTSSCITASWNSADLTCWLSSKSTMDDDPSGNYFPFRGEVTSDLWTTNSEITFDVMAVTGTNGRYTLTYDLALSACAQRGMEIASISDMLAARSVGYDFCGWGWTADNQIGMVLQVAYSWCINPADWNTGFILGSWLTEGNVYCKTNTL